MRPETVLVLSGTRPEGVAKALTQRLGPNSHNAEAILDDLVANHALDRLAPVIPYLSPEHILAFVPFAPFQSFISQHHAILSSDLISTLIFSGAAPVIQGLPPARVADALSQTCEDLADVLGLISPLELPTDSETAILSEFEQRTTNASTTDRPLPQATSTPLSASTSPTPNQPIAPLIPTTLPPGSAATAGVQVPQLPPQVPAAATGRSVYQAPATSIPTVTPPVIPPTRPAAPPNSPNLPTGSAATVGLGEPEGPHMPPRASPPKQPQIPPRPSPAVQTTATSRQDPPVQIDNALTQRQTRRRSLRQSSSNSLASDPDNVQPSSGEESESSYAPSRADMRTPQPEPTSNPQPNTGDPSSSWTGVPPPLSAAPPSSDPDTGDEETDDEEADDEEADDEEADDEDLYTGTDILSPTAFYKRYETYINKEYWKLLESHRCSYSDIEEDRSKWPAALKKHSHTNANRVDLPPVLDPAVYARVWGGKYDRILTVEKKRFLALPNVIKSCAGQVNSARSKGDIYMRRFWAIYMPVNCSITDRDKLQEANAELIDFTLQRFQHLSLETDDTKAARAWIQPIRGALNTFKNRIEKEMEKAPAEPKVKQVHVQRALSFVAGELRRSGAPNLWAKGAGASDVTKEVADRLTAFAQEKGLDVDHREVKAKRLGFRSSAITKLFQLQPKDVQQEYEGKAQDPSMSSAEFADASAPMARSFLDAVAEETGAVALLAYAVKTSEGPILVVSQHGDELKDRSFLQSKGSNFLQPFFEAASDVFSVELGELSLVTADSAVPTDGVNHPWTTNKSSLLSAPKFKVPVTAENMVYNANLLKQSILKAIRNYSGVFPSFSTVISSPGTYIVEGTCPTFLVDPPAMPQPMLNLWVTHWLKSADPDSDLSAEERLRFSGQAVYDLVPPLRDLAEDALDDVDEEYSPPRQAKAAVKKGPPRTSKKKGSSRSTKKNVAGGQAPKSRQLPTREVFVEIPPSQVDLTQYSRFQPTPRRRHPSATPDPATVSTSGPGATADTPTEPEHPQEMASNPVSAEGHPAAGTPATPPHNHRRAATPYIESPPSPPHSSSGPMEIDPPVEAPTPQVPQRELAPKASLLVPYSSDHESSPIGSQASNASSRPLLGSGANHGEDPARASSQDAPNAGEEEAAVPDNDTAVPPESTLSDGENDVAVPNTAVPPTETFNNGEQDTAIMDTAVPPETSDVPSRPRKYAPPRRVDPAVRQSRQAQVAFRTSIQYEFKDTVTKQEIKERVAAWAAQIGRHITDFGRFMREVTAAGLWGITHSDGSLRSLAPLMEAAAVLEWYAACKPLPEQGTIKAGRRRLSIPWANIAQTSPPSRLFTILHSTGDSVPLLSFLLSKEGGWSISDMAQFAHGIIGSVSSALAGSVAPFENIFHSCLDPIPIGRSLILLRQSRSLFKSAPGYNGPTEQLIDSVTDKAIFIFNGLALVQFLYHSVFATVMSAGSAFPATSPQGLLWQRYRECMLCVIESVARALSALRSDFFSSTLPSKLPPTLVTLAQTIAQQPNWWSKFSGTETVKPKALSFTSKSNVYSNKLPQWGTKLHPFEWLALTGMDRASVGIMLSVAVMQITKSGELDERAAMEQCAGLLLHIQYIARFCTFHEAEADGGPVLSPITVLDTAADEWPGNSRWATTRTDATAVPLEPESVEDLPSITFSIDHQSAEELLAAHTDGSVKILSPQKRRAGFT
ncbi:hypothetical protein FRC05_007230, partial [Tulasnella sp. 425]